MCPCLKHPLLQDQQKEQISRKLYICIYIYFYNTRIGLLVLTDALFFCPDLVGEFQLAIFGGHHLAGDFCPPTPIEEVSHSDSLQFPYINIYSDILHIYIYRYVYLLEVGCWFLQTTSLCTSSRGRACWERPCEAFPEASPRRPWGLDLSQREASRLAPWLPQE